MVFLQMEDSIIMNQIAATGIDLSQCPIGFNKYDSTDNIRQI